MAIENWRGVWRMGVCPCVSDLHLEALREGLANDDPALVQGVTTQPPPPLQSVMGWPVEAACALGYMGWKGDGLSTVDAVEEFFAKLCFDADTKIGENAACRWFLIAFDEMPREKMRRELLTEVVLEQSRRESLREALSD